MADLTEACCTGGLGKRSRPCRVSVTDLFKLLGAPASKPSPMLPAEVQMGRAEPAPVAQVAGGAPASGAPTHGLTIAKFAAWAGADRRRVSQHLVEIPPGPAPPLLPGQVPCRVIGGKRRIFIADFRGEPSSIGVRNASKHQEAPAGAAQAASSWARQVARFRRG